MPRRGNFLIDSQMQLAGNPSLIDPTKAELDRPSRMTSRQVAQRIDRGTVPDPRPSDRSDALAREQQQNRVPSPKHAAGLDGHSDQGGRERPTGLHLL